MLIRLFEVIDSLMPLCCATCLANVVVFLAASTAHELLSCPFWWVRPPRRTGDTWSVASRIVLSMTPWIVGFDDRGFCVDENRKYLSWWGFKVDEDRAGKLHMRPLKDFFWREAQGLHKSNTILFWYPYAKEWTMKGRKQGDWTGFYIWPGALSR